MYGITRTRDKYMELFTEPTTTSRQENKQLLGGGPGTRPRRIWVAKKSLVGLLGGDRNDVGVEKILSRRRPDTANQYLWNLRLDL